MDDLVPKGGGEEADEEADEEDFMSGIGVLSFVGKRCYAGKSS